MGNGAITYQSSDDKVAAVNKTTGAVTIHSAGTAVITATDDYEMGTVRYRKSLFSSAVSKSI